MWGVNHIAYLWGKPLGYLCDSSGNSSHKTFVSEPKVNFVKPAKAQILVIEDDLFFQHAIVEALKTCSTAVEPVVVKSATQALGHLDSIRHPFDLVMVDLSLPDNDGVHLINEIHLRWPETPCMVLSVSSERQKVIAAVKAGARGYVVKGDLNLPISAAVDLILSGGSPLSPKVTTYFVDLVRHPNMELAKTSLGLTARERELLVYFSAGHSYKRCAELMRISLSTVQSHTRNLYRKLGVRSGLQAVIKAKGEGLL